MAVRRRAESFWQLPLRGRQAPTNVRQRSAEQSPEVDFYFFQGYACCRVYGLSSGNLRGFVCHRPLQREGSQTPHTTGFRHPCNRKTKGALGAKDPLSWEAGRWREKNPTRGQDAYRIATEQGSAYDDRRYSGQSTPTHTRGTAAVKRPPFSRWEGGQHPPTPSRAALRTAPGHCRPDRTRPFDGS